MLGQLDHGIYNTGDEDWEDIDPRDLQRHYGVDGGAARRGTGAGHPDDELTSDDSDGISDDDDPPLADEAFPADQPNPPSSPSSGALSDLDNEEQQRLEQLVQDQIHHPAIPIPMKNCPFDSLDLAEEFLERLAEIHDDGAVDNIPEGYRLRDDEANYRAYNPVAYIEVGRAKRRINVSLPEEVWKPRIMLWLQALEGLTIELEEL